MQNATDESANGIQRKARTSPLAWRRDGADWVLLLGRRSAAVRRPAERHGEPGMGQERRPGSRRDRMARHRGARK